MSDRLPERMNEAERQNEDGYLLVGLVVVCFLLLLALSVAAPRVAKELERDREVESEHRALEYVRAIQLYYRRNGSYPTSVEQLLGAGMAGAVAGPGQVKYLRQAYKDPLTRSEFRVIHMNEAQTQVKGFFGEPLPGMPVGLGAGMGGGLGGTPSGGAAGVGGATPGGAITSTIGGGTPGSTLDPNMGGQTPGSAITSGVGGSTPGSTIPGSTVSAGTAGSSTSSSTNASTFNGSKGAFLGVGSNGSGKGLVEWNGSEDISQWEFLYDPRVEQLKAKVSILGGGVAAAGSGTLGSGFAPAGAGSTLGTSPTGASGGLSNGATSNSGASSGTATGTGTTTPTQ